MTQEEISEGNKLIAEFCNHGKWEIWKINGYKRYYSTRYDSKEEAQSVIDDSENGYLIGYAEVKYVFNEYHSSWDLLMPACKKWNDLRKNGDEVAKSHEWALRKKNMNSLLDDYEIEPVFENLVSNIKWHNQTKSK